MARLLRRRLQGSEEGFGLVTALVIVLAVFSIAGVWLGVSAFEFSQSSRDRWREQARNAAEAGVNQAMSGLSVDDAYPGEALTTLPGATGQYEVAVEVIAAGAGQLRRRIVATGYAPSRDAPRRLVGRIEQEVALLGGPSGGEFDHAMVSDNVIVLGNNTVTKGNVFSNSDIELSNNAYVTGTVTTMRDFFAKNNVTVGGDVHAGRDLELSNNAVALGDVYSGRDIRLGEVRGDAQAAGTISGGSVDGSRSPISPPPPPVPVPVPQFTWNPDSYSPAGQEWTSPALFQAYWNVNRDALSGHHRILCPGVCATTLDLSGEFTMTGDTTVASDSPIVMRVNTEPETDAVPVTLTLVSLDSGSKAIDIRNNFVAPEDVTVIVAAPNGEANFENNVEFTGAVLAETITVGNNFNQSFEPISVPGFGGGPVHYVIEAVTFREVPVL